MNSWTQSLDAWLDHWAAGLWNATWQGALAIALAWGIVRACKFLPARVGCWVWRLVCIKLLVALVWIQPLSIPLLPAPAAKPLAAKAAIHPPLITDPGTTSDATAAPVARSAPAHETSNISLYQLLLCAWLLGVGFCVRRTLREGRAIRQLIGNTQSAPEPLQALCRQAALRMKVGPPPELRAAPAGSGPLLTGVIRPIIVLPRDALDQFDSAELRMMLAHELAHLKRRDLSWNWLPTVVGWLFFFHPLVWLLRRNWSEAQESACDELVLEAQGVKASEYGRLLLRLATHWNEPAVVSPLAAGVLGGYRELERRIVLLARSRTWSSASLWTVATCIALAGVLATVPWRLVAQEVTATVAQAPAEAKPQEKPAKKPENSDAEVVFQVAETPPAEQVFSEKHQRAAKLLESKKAYVGPFSPRGSHVMLSTSWTGTAEDLQRIADLDDLQGIIVEDCRKLPADVWPGLKKLPAPKLLQFVEINDAQLAELADWKGVRSLSIISGQVTDAGVKSIARHSGLTSLLLAGHAGGDEAHAKITNTGLAPLADCRELDRLTLNNLDGIDGTTLSKLAALPKLTQLMLTQIPITDAGLAEIAKFPHLTNLWLTGTSLSSQGYAALADLKTLERLNLWSASTFNDTAARSLAELPRLWQLSISQAKLSDAALVPISTLHRLQALALHELTLTDAGATNLARLDRLRSLSLHGDLQITDAGMQQLAALSKLQALSLAKCPITDAGLAALAKCPDLVNLSLENTRIQGAAFSELANCTKLTSLNIDDSPIADDQLQHLAKLPALTKLDLDNTPISDAGLADIGKLLKLKELSLTGTKITDAGLDRLANLKSLWQLRLPDEDRVSQAAMDRLQKKLPKAQIGNIQWSLGFVSLENDFVPYDDDPPAAEKP